MMRRTIIAMLTAVSLAAVCAAADADLNGDGVVNRNDYDLLATAIIEGRYVSAYDLDGNGELDAVDSNLLLDDANYVVYKTYKVNGVSFTMVGVAGGTFTMGATAEQGSDYNSNERPTHQVTLSDYWIGETEVTEALWTAVMGSNPSYYKKGDNYPVEYVSWNACQTFISKLNSLTGETFRLPTEAEWEFAARGGTQSKGYKYSGSNTLDNVAWYDGNCGAKHPVATKAANELGLYDMSGNVWEWCQDWYGSSYYSSSPTTNPTGPSTGSYRVDRGGGWGNSARNCRVSIRNNYTPSYTECDLGLRLAR